MDSEMVQNWTSHFSITFNKHDQIQPKKCKKLQQMVKTWSDSTFCDHNRIANLIIFKKSEKVRQKILWTVQSQLYCMTGKQEQMGMQNGG